MPPSSCVVGVVVTFWLKKKREKVPVISLNACSGGQINYISLPKCFFPQGETV